MRNLKELKKKAEEVELIDEANLDEFYYRGGKFTEERLEEDRLFAEMEKAVEEAGKSDSEIMKQRRILKRHKRLAGFYKQQYPYLPAFQHAYRIFEEEGLADNPVWLAHTMVGLERYFVASRQASQNDLEEPHPTNQ